MGTQGEHWRIRRRILRSCLRDPRSLVEVGSWWRHRSDPPLSIRRPWMNRPARTELASLVTPGIAVIEIGSGASTLCFEDRGAAVWSLEHDQGWAQQVRGRLARAESVELVEPDEQGALRSERTGQAFDSYLRRIAQIPKDSADLVMIDGRCRVECIRRLRDAVRPGGWLILDDSQREAYREGLDLLVNWRRIDAKGFKPPYEITRTSFFQRPGPTGG